MRELAAKDYLSFYGIFILIFGPSEMTFSLLTKVFALSKCRKGLEKSFLKAYEFKDEYPLVSSAEGEIL